MKQNCGCWIEAWQFLSLEMTKALLSEQLWAFNLSKEYRMQVMRSYFGISNNLCSWHDISAATAEEDKRIAILREFALSLESEKIHRALIPKLFLKNFPSLCKTGWLKTSGDIINSAVRKIIISESWSTPAWHYMKTGWEQFFSLQFVENVIGLFSY